MTKAAQNAPQYRDALSKIKEIFLSNVLLAGAIASPTGEEAGLIQYLHDRFKEAGLNHATIDEAGNSGAILPGTSKRHILVAAHLDKIWSKSENHTVKVSDHSFSGCGIADNSLGVALLASLPMILDALKIKLDSNLILLGTTRSLGPGNLGGMRFFLDHATQKIEAGLCLEGVELGRLSYSSLGMFRGEITVQLDTESNWPWHGAGTGAIGLLSNIIDSILRIDRPETPRTSILLGSVRSGSGYNVPPPTGVLRFEVRSESEQVVDRICCEIGEIVEEISAREACSATLSILARRCPGNIGFAHPLVKAAREIMEALEITPRVAPSISELSALLDHGIPGLTLGITTGEKQSTPEESINIDDIFTGVAQIVATLEFIDQNPLSLNE
jgi:tripeptide aminopeptidase